MTAEQLVKLFEHTRTRHGMTDTVTGLCKRLYKVGDYLKLVKPILSYSHGDIFRIEDYSHGDIFRIEDIRDMYMSKASRIMFLSKDGEECCSTHECDTDFKLATREDIRKYGKKLLHGR